MLVAVKSDNILLKLPIGRLTKLVGSITFFRFGLQPGLSVLVCPACRMNDKHQSSFGLPFSGPSLASALMSHYRSLFRVSVLTNVAWHTFQPMAKFDQFATSFFSATFITAK